jgi:carbon storage regulator
MLVLSRRPGERLVLPHLDVAVTVLAVKGHVVRLGISAPEAVTVYREEAWQRICQEGRDPAPERIGAPAKQVPAGADKEA